MGLKYYIFESKLDESEVIREITWQEYESISKILGKVDSGGLSFPGTFDQKKRVVLPFKTSAKREIDKLKDWFQLNKYTLDFEEGVAKREFTIPQGPKKGEKSVKKIKIGKLLNKINDLSKKYNDLVSKYDAEWRVARKGPVEERPGALKAAKKMAEDIHRIFKELKKLAPDFVLTEEPEQDSDTEYWIFTYVNKEEIGKYTDFWNKRSEYYRKNPKEAEPSDKPRHTIIISRHPVDVLRMSDFQGITSCHSPASRGGGGSYYNCAIAEAQGHGLVAYLVENEEIPEDFDPEKGEVFADAKRDVPGINPIARLRLRKFVYRQEDEIAVPETRVYGKRVPGFREAVVEWARTQDTFKELFVFDEGEYPDLDDFTRYGGSYEDSKDGEIFNQLIGEDVYNDWANAEHDTEEEENTFDEYVNGAAEAQYRADRNLEHCSVYHEVDDYGDGPFVSYSGYMQIELNDGDLDELIGHNWTYEHQIARKMRDYLSRNGIYIGRGIDIEFNDRDDTISFNVTPENTGPDPEGFDDFVGEMIELDGQYDKAVRLVRFFLIEEEVIVEPTGHEQLRAKAKGLEAEGKKLFKNFETEVDDDEGEIHFVNEIPMYISLRGFDKDASEARMDKIFSFVGDKFLEALEIAAKKTGPEQIELPGLEDKEDESDIRPPDVRADDEEEEKPEKMQLVSFTEPELDIDITAKVSSRYKEYSIGEVKIDFMSSEIYDLRTVWSAFQYVKWMDNNPQQVGRMLQKAFDDAAVDQGLHPEVEKMTIDLTQYIDRQFKKRRYDKYPWSVAGSKPHKWAHYSPVAGVGQMEKHAEVDVEYLDVGDDIIITAVIPEAPKVEVTVWLDALMVALKKNLAKYGRNLLVPRDSLELAGGRFRHPDYEDLNLNTSFKEFPQRMTNNKDVFMFDRATDIFELYPFLKGKLRANLQGPMLSLKFDSIRENLLLNGRAMLFENDEQISGFVDRLVKDKKVRDLVRAMKPLDVAKVVAVNLDLQPQRACKTALNLIKHAHDVHYEGISSPGIESNKEFPVPPEKKRDKPRLLRFKQDESTLARPQGKTMWGRPGPADVPRHHFPPDPRDEPEEWPFDDMTVASMKPSHRSPKRPLTAAKDNSDSRAWKQKGNPLNPDLKIRQPGGDGAGGGGIYRLTFQTKTGDMPGAGNKSWVAKGTKGWNSMPGAEFDNPDAENDQPKDLKKKPPTGEAMGGGSVNVNPKSQNAGDEDEDEPKFLKNPPVGSSRPSTNFGGRTPAQPAGYRNWMKK